MSYQSMEEVLSFISMYYRIFPFWSGDKVVTTEFPRYPEKEWKCLTQSTFKKLWHSNAAVLVLIKFREDNESYYLQWNKFNNESDSFCQPYFMPCRQKFNPSVPAILQKLGMTLTWAPLKIKSHLEALELSSKVADKKEVFKFYKNFHSKILQESSLPCLIQQTPFETVDAFMALLNYVLLDKITTELPITSKYKFPSPPWELPLLLSANNCLAVFNQNSKLLCSEYSELFPETQSRFLHPEIVSLKLDPIYFAMANSTLNDEVNAILQATCFLHFSAR